MNLLQQFIAAANAQTQDVLQELVQLDGKEYYGTFGDAVLMPIMTRAGYEDQLVTGFRASRTQFSEDPAAHSTLTRVSTGHNYFVQIIDTSNPVLYVFQLTDREV